MVIDRICLLPTRFLCSILINDSKSKMFLRKLIGNQFTGAFQVRFARFAAYRLPAVYRLPAFS